VALARGDRLADPVFVRVRGAEQQGGGEEERVHGGPP